MPSEILLLVVKHLDIRSLARFGITKSRHRALLLSLPASRRLLHIWQVQGNKAYHLLGERKTRFQAQTIMTLMCTLFAFVMDGSLVEKPLDDSIVMLENLAQYACYGVCVSGAVSEAISDRRLCLKFVTETISMLTDTTNGRKEMEDIRSICSELSRW